MCVNCSQHAWIFHLALRTAAASIGAASAAAYTSYTMRVPVVYASAFSPDVYLCTSGPCICTCESLFAMSKVEIYVSVSSQSEPSMGPSSLRQTSGPVSPFIPSGIDVLFTSGSIAKCNHVRLVLYEFTSSASQHPIAQSN